MAEDFGPHMLPVTLPSKWSFPSAVVNDLKYSLSEGGTQGLVFGGLFFFDLKTLIIKKKKKEKSKAL